MSMLPMWSQRKKNAGTITNGTATYNANDVVGGLLTFTDFARNREGDKSGGYVSDVYLVDADNLKASLDLYLFREAPTAIADGDSLTLTVAEALGCFAKIPVSTYSEILKTGGGTIGWAHVDELQHEFGPGADGNLYGYLVGAPDAYTSATALSVALGGFTY